MMSIKGLAWRIGRRMILRNINLEFQAGEFWAIIGPNGAGKSSLLRFLAGIQHLKQGAVCLEGKPLDSWGPKSLARKRALLRQKPSQSLPFLVHEVIAMGRYPHVGTDGQMADQEAIENAIRLTETQALLDQNWHSLSGGEQQRVEMARVLAQIHRPEGIAGQLLLLDEPLNNLDLAHQAKTLQLAQALAKQGALVIAVLHDLNFAMQFCSHCAIVEQGECKLAGPSQEVMQPETLQKIFGIPMQIQTDPEGRRHLLPGMLPAVSQPLDQYVSPLRFT